MLFLRIVTSQTKWQCAHAKGSDKQRSISFYSARSTPTSVTACTQPQALKTTRKCSQHHAERKRPHIGSNAQGSFHSSTSDYSGKDRRQVTARNSQQLATEEGKGKRKGKVSRDSSQEDTSTRYNAEQQTDKGLQVFFPRGFLLYIDS
jgi:hypothetical protein